MPDPNRSNSWLSRKQVRQVDQIAIAEFGISGMLLMENAGRGCFEQLLKCGCSGPVTVCCGSGNNGGDGFVIARLLHNKGIQTKVIQFADRRKYSGDALENLEAIEAIELEIVVLQELPIENWESNLESCGDRKVDWIVDALLGTGATGSPREPMDKLVALINSIDAKRMAIDIPTGMDCDTGECFEPTVDADVTCTFVAGKKGFGAKSAMDKLGEVEIVDIGVPNEIIERVCLL